MVPADLSTCIAWWRSEDIPSGGADPINWDDAVSGWRLQASGTTRPTYSASAIGGLPGLVFDGTDDCLITTTAKAVGNQLGVAMVIRRDQLRDDDRLFSLHTSASTAALNSGDILTAGMDSTASIIVFWDFAAGSWEYFRPVVPATTDTLLTVVRGETEIAFCVDGLRARGTSLPESPATPSTGQPTLSGTCYFHFGKRSTSLFFKGRVSEIVIWNEPYDCRHRPWIEGYLAHKYGIALGTWHPFYSASPSTLPFSEGLPMPFTAPLIVRTTGDTKSITFQWPTLGATITGTVSLDNASYGAVAGAIAYLRTDNGNYYYTLAYNASDRPTAEGTARYKVTDGTYTREFVLRVDAVQAEITTVVTSAQTAIVTEINANETKIDTLTSSLTTLAGKFTGITLLADWLRRAFRKDAGTAGMATAESEIATGGTTTYVGTTDNLEAIKDASGGSAPSAADIADAVWDEVISSGHAVPGSAAVYLTSAGGAADPWLTALPGSYVAGSAGYIIGTEIAALLSAVNATTVTVTGYAAIDTDGVLQLKRAHTATLTFTSTSSDLVPDLSVANTKVFFGIKDAAGREWLSIEGTVLVATGLQSVRFTISAALAAAIPKGTHFFDVIAVYGYNSSNSPPYTSLVPFTSGRANVTDIYLDPLDL